MNASPLRSSPVPEMADMRPPCGPKLAPPETLTDPPFPVAENPPSM